MCVLVGCGFCCWYFVLVCCVCLVGLVCCDCGGFWCGDCGVCFVVGGWVLVLFVLGDCCDYVVGGGWLCGGLGEVCVGWSLVDCLVYCGIDYWYGVEL